MGEGEAGLPGEGGVRTVSWGMYRLWFGGGGDRGGSPEEEMDRRSREGAAWPNLCFSCTWSNGSYHGLKITGGHGCQQQWISVRQPGYKIRACRLAKSIQTDCPVWGPTSRGLRMSSVLLCSAWGPVGGLRIERRTRARRGARETRRQRDRHWSSCRKEQVLWDDCLSSLELQLGVSPLSLGVGGRRWDEVHV